MWYIGGRGWPFAGGVDRLLVSTTIFLQRRRPLVALGPGRTGLWCNRGVGVGIRVSSARV